MRMFVSTIVVIALATSPLVAHGGKYNGPADAAGPNASGGGAVAPPTNPGGAAALGPGATSGGALTAAGTGSGNVRGGSARKARTAGGSMELGRGYEIWEFWWENNKDLFLNLKDRLIKTSNTSGSIGFLTGRGRKSDTAGNSRRPTRAMINSEVIPPLIDLINAEDNRDIIDSAILALGRIGQDDMALDILEAAQPLLEHPEISVQSSTTLALGVLGATQATPLLKDLMADTSNGRQMTGGGEVPWLVRAFAALSLGLTNDPDAVQPLIDVIENLSDANKDIKVCAVVALGLMENDQSPAAIAFLSQKLNDRKLDALIKSYIPTTLGKLAGRDNPEVVKPVLDAFTDRDANNFVRQSAAIGLGRVANITDEDALEALMDYIQEGKDVQTRHFCLISLAKIAAADTDMQASQKSHERIVKMLMTELTKPSFKGHESWAGLASALYGRAHTDKQPMMIERLKQAYEDQSDPSYKAAFAVALGLLGSKEMAVVIYEDFLKSKNNDFRGYAAISLGLTNHTEAAEALRNICRNKTTSPTFRLQVATALGLMSDEEAVGTLIETLGTAETLGVSSAVAKALGLIGDQDAISPLRDIAQDDSNNDLTRAFACVALGIVGEKTDLPWNARISADNNYRARVPAIDEVLDIL